MSNEKQEKKEEPKAQPTQTPPIARQIVIAFDAQQARIISGQVSSHFELIGVLVSLLETVKSKK